jgi:hypothetical protein
MPHHLAFVFGKSHAEGILFQRGWAILGARDRSRYTRLIGGLINSRGASKAKRPSTNVQPPISCMVCGEDRIPVGETPDSLEVSRPVKFKSRLTATARGRIGGKSSGPWRRGETRRRSA